MDDSPIILSLETATLGGSVFLVRGETQLATRVGDSQLSHSNTLLRDINDSLVEAGLSLEDVQLFACASGPGSFTGLRIGIATLKALAATLARPCVGVPTLQAVAHASGHSRATVALLPAGRGEVFAQMFSVLQDGEVTEVDAAAHLSPQRLVEKYSAFAELTWAGSGAYLYRDFLQDFAQAHDITFDEQPSDGIAEDEEPGHRRWSIARQEANFARSVAALALQAFERHRLQSPQLLSAIYVRPSDAELKDQCR
jgi:tRNA threonylcarbamoyladenosine biosynthesis protein TsaB